jgi:hypothetical protein
MAKPTKTKRELEQLVMDEARKTGKCADLGSITVLGPVERGDGNWDIATTANNPDHPEHLVNAQCRIALAIIVGRLQAQFDLA